MRSFTPISTMVVALFIASVVSAVPPPISLQGRLKDGAALADGTYDMRYSLWKDAALLDPNYLVAGPICADGVLVQEGLFQLELNFPDGSFDGTTRWLEVGVRPDSTPGNCASGVYTTLAPRMKLTGAPSAVMANTSLQVVSYAINNGGPQIDVLNSGTAGAGKFRIDRTDNNTPCLWAETNGRSSAIYAANTSTEPNSSAYAGYFSGHGLGIYAAYTGVADPNVAGYAGYFVGRGYFSGRVGIGTPDPTAKLHIAGTPGVDGIRLPDGSLLTSASTFWSQSGSDIYYNSGNVGIGTTSPGNRLHVRASPGTIARFHDTATGGAIQLQSDGTGQARVMVGGSGRVAAEGAAFVLDDLTANGLVFEVAGSEKTRILNNGNMGIGTSSPAARLDVNGRAYINNPSGVGTGGWFGDVNTGSLGFFAWNGAGRRVEFRCSGGLNDLKGYGVALTINHDTGQDVYLCAGGGNVGIGTTTPAQRLHVAGSVQATCGVLTCSDERFKTNIADLKLGLHLVDALRPVRFDWRRDQFPEREFEAKRQIGFVAQELIERVPETVSQGADGYYSVDYGRLTPLLTAAVQELHAQLREREAQIAQQQRQIDDLAQRLAALEAAARRPGIASP